MKESYDDDEEEQEGPKSPFGVYVAEGDVLYKQGEYRKAMESYSLALELQHNDKFCLIARSKCYLKLGDPQTALKDAEVALSEDSEFSRGLYQKAEALYSMGDFEYALMYYHRGHKLRPELDDFRLGIQKAQEAIDNSIGTAAKVKLENKGDLSFFQKQDDLNKKSKGYNKPAAMHKQKPMVSNRNKEVKTPGPSSKTVKQLLGELYEDKEYLEKLLKDTEFINSSKNKAVHDLVKDGLNYLEARTEFWRQQKPLYARKKGKHTPRDSKKKSGQQTATFIVKSLEEIDEALANGQPERSLKKAQSTLRNVETINERDLPNKAEIVANLHSCMGNALLDMDKAQKALKHHEKDLDISKKNDNDDGISRALDNIGRAYAKLAKYEKAIDNWSQKLPLTKTALESTWLHHEIGRCHLEIGDHEKAREFGEESLKAAKEAEDEVWQLNASVLIAQADVKLGDYPQAVVSFNDALELATSLQDQAAKNAINKALGDVQKKMAGENSIEQNEEGRDSRSDGDSVRSDKQQSESLGPSEQNADQDGEVEQNEGIARDSLEDHDKDDHEDHDDHDKDLPTTDENAGYNDNKNDNNGERDNSDNNGEEKNNNNENNDENNNSSSENTKEELDVTEQSATNHEDDQKSTADET